MYGSACLLRLLGLLCLQGEEPRADLDLPLRDQEASMDAHRPLSNMEPHLHPYLHSERVSGILCRTS